MTFPVDGQTVSTTAVNIEEDAIAIQVKRGEDVTTASISNLQLEDTGAVGDEGSVVRFDFA